MSEESERGYGLGQCAGEWPAYQPPSRASGQRPAHGERPAAQEVCEHHWAFHCRRGTSVRICMLCHDVDWDELLTEDSVRSIAKAAGWTVETEQGVPEYTLGGICRVTEYGNRQERTVLRGPWREATREAAQG